MKRRAFMKGMLAVPLVPLVGLAAAAPLSPPVYVGVDPGLPGGEFTGAWIREAVVYGRAGRVIAFDGDGNMVASKNWHVAEVLNKDWATRMGVGIPARPEVQEAQRNLNSAIRDLMRKAVT